MTIEELIAKLGIADDKKESAQKEISAFLDGAFVPKSRFNEVNEEKKTLSATVTERDKQLEALKGTAGDTEAMKKQITELQAANKVAQAEADAKLKAYQMSAAIKLALTGSAYDVDIVASLVDTSKLILSEDGKVTGLTDQIETLKKDKAFLFKEMKTPYQPNSGSNLTHNPFSKDSFNLTEQGKLLRENPEQARSLAQAAGVTI